MIRSFKKILVANRGEIAIRILRAAAELNIRTVAVYTYEDRYSLHRYKADESYQIGEDDQPLKPYLNIEEIIRVAKEHEADAIHPGYGFLSENVNFASRCKKEGIAFIGPEPDVMNQLGDKVKAKAVAQQAGISLIPDSKKQLIDLKDALNAAEQIGYPVIIKAAAGGGGRGMRVIYNPEELSLAFYDAKNEAGKSFGDDTVFLEKYILNPKHIEVQILGDNYGNLVHLYERDCSVQRRFQKVVEIAPSVLHPESRKKIFEYALKIAKHVRYNNAGTVEFLVDEKENIYFIEVNPRIQVEHTITEEITGIDIVRSQILIAEGHALDHPKIFLTSQDQIKCEGWAIQCRITTEDPSNNFKPDFGTIIAYRNAGGYGIRLDEGSTYSGVKISPFFDSMLVKISSKGRTLQGAAARLRRALQEFRIRGVKTNIPFLISVLEDTTFTQGKATVGFISERPHLLKSYLQIEKDRGTKILKYLAELQVNGHPDIKKYDKERIFRKPIIPSIEKSNSYPEGSKDLLTKLGREKFIKRIKDEKKILFTDTTLRDAHQSLFATRLRNYDIMKIVSGLAKDHPELFSLEVWGGATFDVTMRFLHEDPWNRLRMIRKAAPNILLQMLFRGSNAVGYAAYPDNLIEKFIIKSAENGIDVFRIFDSLNWVEGMAFSIKTVREKTNSIAEACICYTGDILDPKRKKFSLDYYVRLAKQLESAGAHMLCIKDMAGLLKPYAAEVLIKELKKEISIPIHLHTHDTASIQCATYLKAIEAGVDVVDVALASMSGLTSQPNFNSLVAALQGHERECPLNLKKLNEYSNYFEVIREYYYPFESELKAGTAEVYEHEIPGGQYSNLLPQARSLGLENKFDLIKTTYKEVNTLFGDIVKVTPSSKVVGDMAMFLIANNVAATEVISKGETLAFPKSVVQLFKGDLGQSPGGFPADVAKVILKEESYYTEKPNAHLPPIDFEKEFNEFKTRFDDSLSEEDFLSYKMYPKVFEDFYLFRKQMGEVECIPTPAFYFPLKPNEEILVEIQPGKTLLIRFAYAGKTDENGMKEVFFKINGQTRNILVLDQSVKLNIEKHRKVSNEKEVGSPLQGRIIKLCVNPGDKVEKNQALFIVEAMKMESTVTSPMDGSVKEIILKENTFVEQSDLVICLN